MFVYKKRSNVQMNSSAWEGILLMVLSWLGHTIDIHLQYQNVWSSHPLN